MALAVEFISEEALASVLRGAEVVADLGQVNGLWKRTLEREVQAGRLTKWRGHWHPVTGAPWGIGPLKTCYGTHEAKQAVFA